MKEKRKLTMLHARGYDYNRNVPSVIIYRKTDGL